MLKRYNQKKYISDDNIDILEEALVGATNHSPEARLNSEQFIGLLLRWYRLKNTKDLSQKFHQWKHIINKIFNFGIPIKAVWDDKHEILDILREITDTGGVCEMSFPFGGGMSIKKVELNESGEFEVTDGGNHVHVFKSERLEFHSFKKNKHAHYFLAKVKKQKGKLQKKELSEHNEYIEWFIEDIDTGLIKGLYEDGGKIEAINDSNKRIICLWKNGNIMFTGIANDISLTNANYCGFGKSSGSKKIKKHIKNIIKRESKKKLKRELNNTALNK